MVPVAADRQTRAAVTRAAAAIVGERAPESVEVLVLEDGVELETIDFLVPEPGNSDIIGPLPSLTRLSVVQILSAGTDWLDEIVPPQATLCSARGARDGPVSEWILGALLGVSAGLLQSAHERTWDGDRHLQDLGGWTVLIVGMGSIGRMLQTRLNQIGTTVVGVASHARDDLRGIDELAGLLASADAVVLLTPLTDATRGLIGGPELAALRDGAVVVNAARGAVLDTDALLSEVQGGRLRAVLDVTEPEPLPEGHPLWNAPGVLCITPHIAGDSPLGHARASELAGDQLARWCRGEPLLNVVRKGIR